MLKKQSPKNCDLARISYSDRFLMGKGSDVVVPVSLGDESYYVGAEASLGCPNSQNTTTELGNKRPKNRKEARRYLFKIAAGSVCDGCELFGLTKEEYAQEENAKNDEFIARLITEVPLPKPVPNPHKVVDLAYKVVQAHAESGIENIEDFANLLDFEEDDTED